MKDIDKMSSNELRAEVRVLRAMYEAAKYATAECHNDWELGRMSVDARGAINTLSCKISAVEKQDDSGSPTPAEPEHCAYCNQGMRILICGKTKGVGDGFIGFACTRTPDHDGDHVACGAHHNVSSWSNTEASRQDPK